MRFRFLSHRRCASRATAAGVRPRRGRQRRSPIATRRRALRACGRRASRATRSPRSPGDRRPWQPRPARRALTCRTRPRSAGVGVRSDVRRAHDAGRLCACAEGLSIASQFVPEPAPAGLRHLLERPGHQPDGRARPARRDARHAAHGPAAAPPVPPDRQPGLHGRLPRRRHADDRADRRRRHRHPGRAAGARRRRPDHPQLHDRRHLRHPGPPAGGTRRVPGGDDEGLQPKPRSSATTS